MYIYHNIKDVCISFLFIVYDSPLIIIVNFTSYITFSNTLYFKTDKEAGEFEKASILKFKPKFNTVFTDNNNRGELAKESNEVRLSMKKFPIDKSPKYKGFDYNAYKELVDEFVNHFGYKFATDDNFKIYGYHFYKQIGADKLRALSRFIREGSHKLSKNNHKMAFYDCVKELYGVELGDCLATRGI